MAILATIAGLAISTYGSGEDGAEGQARAGVLQAELVTIQQALVRFHQDTGWLPGQGPFDLAGSLTGKVPAENLPGYVQGAPTALHRPWLLHPANLWALLVNPLRDPDGAGLTHSLPDPLGQWDPVRRRGWNGPYLGVAGSGLCVVPDVPLGWTGRTPDWNTAAPLGGATPLPVLALHDPLGRGPIEASGVYTWYGHDYSGPGTGTAHFLGHPYLLLDAAERPTDPTSALIARVVSLGPDGRYAGSLPASFTAAGSLLVTDPTSDDVGRFVHR